MDIISLISWMQAHPFIMMAFALCFFLMLFALKAFIFSRMEKDSIDNH